MWRRYAFKEGAVAHGWRRVNICNFEQSKPSILKKVEEDVYCLLFLVYCLLNGEQLLVYGVNVLFVACSLLQLISWWLLCVFSLGCILLLCYVCLVLFVLLVGWFAGLVWFGLFVSLFLWFGWLVGYCCCCRYCYCSSSFSSSSSSCCCCCCCRHFASGPRSCVGICIFIYIYIYYIYTAFSLNTSNIVCRWMLCGSKSP